MKQIQYPPVALTCEYRENPIGIEKRGAALFMENDRRRKKQKTDCISDSGGTYPIHGRNLLGQWKDRNIGIRRNYLWRTHADFPGEDLLEGTDMG